MTYYMKSGKQYHVTSEDAVQLEKWLPLGTYTIGFNELRGVFFLEKIESFEITGKVYGDMRKTSTRILDTFADRKGSTGVLLSGEKGSGKTMLAKMVSIDAMDRGIPTIVINQPWKGELFNEFMQTLEQPMVVLFDEFEKVYDDEDQEKMLTLLDGVYPSNKLFVLTCNDRYRINSHMRNRPGRIYYRLDFDGLTQEFIQEYCEDNLIDTSHTEGVCRVASVFGRFNFDMLKAMVEEINRYGETAQEAMQILNVRPERDDDEAMFDLTLIVGGKQVPAERLWSGPNWHGNPIMDTPIHITLRPENDGEDLLDVLPWEATPPRVGGLPKPKPRQRTNDGRMRFDFEQEDLRTIDPRNGVFTFVNKEGDILTLTRQAAKVYNWQAL